MAGYIYGGPTARQVMDAKKAAQPPAPLIKTITIYFQYHAEMQTYTNAIPMDETLEIVDGGLSFCDIEGIRHLYNWDLISHVEESNYYPPVEAPHETP